MAAETGQAEAGQTQWRYERVWILLRNVSTLAYVTLLLHELLIRVLLAVGLPIWFGLRLPQAPYQDVFVFLLLGIGLWRLVADSAWRSRLSIPGLPAIAALVLLCAAFMWRNTTSAVDLAMIKGVIIPILLYAVGVFCGVDRKLFLRFILWTALINAVVSVFIAIFLLDPYVQLVYLLDAIMPAGEGIYSKVFRHAGINVPTGLAVARLAYMTIFTAAGLLSLRAYAEEKTGKMKAMYFASILLSTAAVFLTFSRSGVATYLLSVAFYMAAVSLSARRQGGMTKNTGLGLLGTTFAVCIGVFLTVNAITSVNRPNSDFLSGESLTAESGSGENGGRFGMWAGLLNELDRKHGWLLGVKPSFSLYGGTLAAHAKEEVWSENAYQTVDNQYLVILLHGGLAATACYLLACILITAQFWRNKDWLLFGFMVLTLVLDLNLRSGSYGQIVFCLLGGAAVADSAAAKLAPKLGMANLTSGPVRQAPGSSPPAAGAEQLS